MQDYRKKGNGRLLRHEQLLSFKAPNLTRHNIHDDWKSALYITVRRLLDLGQVLLQRRSRWCPGLIRLGNLLCLQLLLKLLSLINGAPNVCHAAWCFVLAAWANMARTEEDVRTRAQCVGEISARLCVTRSKGIP